MAKTMVRIGNIIRMPIEEFNKLTKEEKGALLKQARLEKEFLKKMEANRSKRYRSAYEELCDIPELT